VKSGNYRKVVSSVISYAFLSAGAALYIIPLFWMISTSLKIDSQLFKIPPVWIPNPIVWSNYYKAVTLFPFLQYLSNTLFLCVMNIAGSVISSCIVAYGLSHIKWPGREAVFLLVLATMMLAYQVRMIPLYITFNKFGLTGSFLALWIQSFLGLSAFFIFLLRQFFLTIPNDLSDAAKLDGCSEVGILWRIVLPLSKPAIFTVVLFEFLWTWNDFLNPLIYLNDSSKFTLSLGLKFFQGMRSAQWALLMAASSLITIPIIILFFFTQRTFIQGITLTGLKG